METASPDFWDGLHAEYLRRRNFTDMADARDGLVSLMRRTADDLEARRILPDGTELDEPLIEL